MTFTSTLIHTTLILLNSREINCKDKAMNGETHEAAIQRQKERSVEPKMTTETIDKTGRKRGQCYQ